MFRSLALASALLCAPLAAIAQEGMASWYGAESGSQTASGQRFNPEGSTCAMRTHSWHWVTVTVIATGASARCYVNDFGPAARTGRLIDVSHGIAHQLGFVSAGVARVRVE
jgi:rare lipoprotein A